MTRLRALALGTVSLALAFTAACSLGGSLESEDPATVEETTFAASLGVDLTKSTQITNGAYIRDLVVGTGPMVTTGDSVSVKYTGWLANGTQFDSNTGSATPYGVRLGAGKVIAGWDKGIPGMRVGGTRQLLIPPVLAYGYYSVGPIPANSVLVFTVQIVGNP
ncbi:MAG TPA: FKBP-type peptidyl-prolyl cis-trans isomerase [Gemmatimonadaceae bacterium]|nr:FKBP-type peptidyl-prolyl cis-trans isomerase [Gemmatimonadaceae bacterium]